MESKKVATLLRAVADLMEETTSNVVEMNKEFVKTTEKVVEQTVSTQKDFLEHSLKLMRKIEENDTIRTYKNKLTKSNSDLKNALEEIQKMREQAVNDLIRDSMEVMLNPSSIVDKTTKNMKKMGEQVMDETKIISKVFKV
jgi:organic radical activating enzyme